MLDANSTRLPFDFDIFEPSSSTMPWLMRLVNGSVKSTRPMSKRTFVMNRAYSRCRIACSTPPMYESTGAHLDASAVGNGSVAPFGARKRRKYHELSTNVSIVSASRSAGSPVSGSTVVIHSVAPPSGDVPFGFRSRPFASGSTTGSCSSGTGTMRPSSVWIIGMGVPQKRWREISQSRRR